MKKITIPFELMADVKAGQVVNLRESDGMLQPVGNPATMGVSDVDRVLDLGRGFHLCVETDGQTLVVVSDGGRVERPGTAGGRVCGVSRSDGNSWWVMTDAGPELLTLDSISGKFELMGSPPGFGTVRLGIGSGAEYVSTVSPKNLSGTYLRGSGALDAEDSRTVGEELIRAYDAMSYRAELAGCLFQPVMAAWRLVDGEGRELFRSTPQWLGPECGFSLCGSFTTSVVADDGNYCRVEPFNIIAKAWRPTVKIEQSAVTSQWAGRVSRLEIVATKPIEFIDRNAMAEASMTVSVATGASTLRMFMPGASRGYSTDLATLRGLLARAVSEFDETAEVVAVVSNPFDGRWKEEKAVAMKYSGMKPLVTKLPSALTLPNRFAAMTSHESGTITIHGNLLAIGCAGPVAADIATSTIDEECRQQTVVTLANGETLVTLSSTEMPTPGHLPPIIVCPASDAVRLMLQSGNEAMTMNLEASACGRRTYWQADGFTPTEWMPTATPWTVVRQTSKPKEYPSAILCALAQTPLNPMSCHEVCRGNVMKITRAVGAAGGWNYGRQHLLVWADDGVYALSVDRSMATAGSSMLYGVGISRADAVTTAPNAAYAAMADGRLVRICGTKITEISLPVSAKAVAWVDCERELWIIDSLGTPCILTTKGSVYFRKPIKIQNFASRRLAVTIGNELIDISQEMRAEETEVKWSRRVEVKLPRTSMATWIVDSELAEIDLRLEADSGGALMKIAELHVSGQLNAPLSARIYSPSRRWLTVKVEGRLTAPSRLLQLVISN